MNSEHPEFESPVDLPPGPQSVDGSLGWTTGVIAIATLILFLMNGFSLRDWTEQLPPGPRQAAFAASAERWQAATDQIGLGMPRAALHRVWKTAQAARFPGATKPDEAQQ
jgi:hypothetical protein